MKTKKIIISIVAILITILAGFGIYYYFFNEDQDSTLTMAEKQWIEDNKNKIVDLGIINDIPIYNYNGEGVFFDFIDDIEKNTGLEFNRLSYKYGTEKTAEYSFVIKDKIENNDLLLAEDEYVILSNNKIKYNNISQIGEMTIAVLQADIDDISYYLSDNKNLKFKSYDKIENMIQDISSDKTTDITAIALPKTIYLQEIFKNDLQINYNITEMTKKIVFQLGNDKKLNTIITKYFEKWKNNFYKNSYNQHFTNYYLESNNIADDAEVKFKSKQYKYGYINYAPYDSTKNGKLIGLNSEILAAFAKTANIEVKYESEYKNAATLMASFNKNEIDFYFDAYSNNGFDIDTENTISSFDEKIVVLAKKKTNFIVNSISSLKNYQVLTLKNSKISAELQEKQITVKEYDDVESIIEKQAENDLIVIDKSTYEAYQFNSLKDCQNIYDTSLDNQYSYIIRDIKDNKVFIQFFNFYLSFMNEKEFYNKVDYTVFDKTISNSYIIPIIIIILVVILCVLFFTRKKDPVKNKNTNISKENKLKYIDLLTSLKNRNYLNDQIEKWDESGIYPQAIVIVDLNNVAYINDNYGHTEGDTVIKEAAGILFKTQLENTEIMRTNGNEFLIYLVNYEEKQVISYTRKLNKEMKDLSHGFGAAVGYSMITDGLKTIDDAINEATLDMRSNKEEANN